MIDFIREIGNGAFPGSPINNGVDIIRVFEKRICRFDHIGIDNLGIAGITFGAV